MKPLSRRAAFSLVELLVVLGVVAVLFTILRPLFLSSTAKAREIACVNNLRQLGFGIRQYALDHNGYVPLRRKPVNTATASQWHREMWPSLRGPHDLRDWATARDQARKANDKGWLFQCPSDNPQVTLLPGLSYAMSESVIDARLAALSAKTVLLIDFQDKYTATGSAEQLALRLPGRHQGRDHFLFADHHMESLTPAEVPDIRKDRLFWGVR